MKIPVISSNARQFEEVAESFRALNDSIGTEGSADQSVTYNVLQIDNTESAIEYINYQIPGLIVVDFASDGFDGFEVMGEIIADPWLNHGGIIALFDDAALETRIGELSSSNIIISISHREIAGQLPNVLRIIHANQRILFQRAIQSEFVSSISGEYEIAPDISIMPCYANLIANYLFNMGFIDAEAKGRFSLSLVELLINAIEHGTCGIGSEEKRKYLEEHGTIQGLIAERVREPEIARKKIVFEYDINPERSVYQIKDDGAGFDWKPFVSPKSELDLLSFHGRGILLTLNGVDTVTYNDIGNKVNLTLTHRQNTTNTVPAVFQDREVEVFQPGDKVFRQGEESDFLYYIAEGEYRVEVEGKQVATMTPADILIGEMSFLLQEHRSADVVANTSGKLIKISSVALINSIKNQPYYGLFLAKLLAQRLYDLARTKVR